MTGCFVTRCLEAVLYEDMCALFNIARESHLQRREDESAKTLKRRLALQRATVVAAFNVIEAYLNGIAFNHVELHPEQIDEESKIMLTEWDSARNRARYISLRDKLLHYPKLIMNLEHPPLQESNCYEMKFLLEAAKALRDAIVHASPALTVATLEAEKEVAVHGVEFETVERVVDAVVALIRKLEEAVNDSDQRVRQWLLGRSPDGFFPDTAFE